MTKDGPFCGCFGSPRGRQPLPPRPKSAPERGTKPQAATMEESEGWRIGSYITQTLQPQPSTPPVSPGTPVHGGVATLGPSVPGRHNTSAPPSFPVRPASTANGTTAVQSRNPAAAADVDPSAVDEQQQHMPEQQHIPEQRHSSSHVSQVATAQPSAATTAAAASTQAASHGDKSQQHMPQGIPGFGAMTPAQQSAAILAKWGFPELQMQQQQEQQQQQQQEQAGNTVLEAAPSSTDSAQQGGPPKLASAADVLIGVAPNTHQARLVGLGDTSAPEASLHPALAHDGQQDSTDSMQIQQDSQQPQKITSSDAGQHHKTALAAGTQSGNQPQGDTQGSSDLVSEHAGAHEGAFAVERPDGEGSSGRLQQGGESAEGGGLVSGRTGGPEGGPVLEQPDGEGPNLLWTPEVVRGRVVRATEMWHRQRIQQEASQQAQQTSEVLAQLRGHNQNEQLAVPLLRLAGALQAALAWQQKVGEYSAQSLLLSQQGASVQRQPSGSARQLSGLARKATAGGTPRAVQQMEAQLRATRQDALQLATAVVRLEKEKAALQTQVSGERSMASAAEAQATPIGAQATPAEAQATTQGTPSGTQATPASRKEQGCMTSSNTEGEAPAGMGDMDRQASAAAHAQEGAHSAAAPQLQTQPLHKKSAWIHIGQGNAGVSDADADAQASGQPDAAVAEMGAADSAEVAQASTRAAPSSPGSHRQKANMGQRRKPWGSSMAFRLGSRDSSQSLEGSGSRDRAAGGSPQWGLSQSSLRLRSGLSAVGSLLGSFHGGKTDSSRSEGHSPKHDVGRLPSFMVSTKSSQAHMHGQPSQAAADSQEQGVHKEPFRPSGVRLVVSSDSDAEHAAEGGLKQAQHAQHAHAELSPRSITSAASGSFMDGIQSSPAHHSAEVKQQHAQHDPRKDEHHRQNAISSSSTAGQGGGVLFHGVHDDIQHNVNRLLPQTTVHESQTSLDGASEQEQGLGDTKRFMQPTVSSLAHTTGSPRTSIGKSASMTNI